MTGPVPKPSPTEWIRAYGQVQVVSDSQILAVLGESQQRVRQQMHTILSRPQQTMSDTLRYRQMAIVRKALLQEQARVMRATGKIVEARRLEAAARAIKLGTELDNYALSRLGRKASSELLTNLTRGLARTTQVAMARMEYSYTKLAQRIYNTDVWLGSRLDKRITAMLAQGLSAREFAAEAIDWFNPDTPGGIRYAALRLARSEINNAFHAVAVQQAQDKPWIHSMKWYLSGSHPKPDICDEYAREDKYHRGPGVFPKEDVPRKPHPHCYCYVAPEQLGEDDFLENLTQGRYDEYIAKQRQYAEDPQPRMDPVRRN